MLISLKQAMSPDEIRLTCQLATELLDAHAQHQPLDPQLALDLAERVKIMAEGYLQMYRDTLPHFPRTLKMGEITVVLDQIIAIETDFQEEPISDICACIRLGQDIDYYVPLRYKPALERLLAMGLDLEGLLPETEAET